MKNGTAKHILSFKRGCYFFDDLDKTKKAPKELLKI
jgi:hypothetical protein